LSQLKIFSLVAGLICGGIVICISIAFAPFYLQNRENERWLNKVFVPFKVKDLHADCLHNGFGVFVLEFYPYSDLNDSNCDRLLLLNELPERYDLTVEIKTEHITDGSIVTLARLSRVDYLVVDDSGMTPEGIAKLKSLLPQGIVVHNPGKGTNQADTK
jgi:hypothetical protein